MKSAFTLIELMVVITLIGIATALILPDMKGTFDDLLLRSTARDLVAACGLASSQAVTLNQPHRVRLDLNTGHYLVERTGRRADQGREFVAAEDVPGARGELDNRITIKIRRTDDDDEGKEKAPEERQGPSQSDPQWRPSDGDVMTFYPDGTAESGEIILQDRQGFRLALRIERATGRVRVMELPRQ